MWNESPELHLERLVRGAGRLRRALIALGAVATLAWAGVAAGWPRQVFPRAETAGNAVAPGLEELAENRVDKATIVRATQGKALFRSSGQGSDKAVDELGRYELRGVFARGGVAKASIRDTKRKKTLLKQAGDMLDSYEIVEVGERSLRLRRGEEEVSLVR